MPNKQGYVNGKPPVPPISTGRPSKGGKMVSIRLSEESLAMLPKKGKTAYIEKAIKEKHEREK